MEEVALALVLLTGCDGEDASFGDREFVSESVEGYELLPNSFVRMNFGRDRGFSVWAGCNRIDGEYRLAEGRFVVDGIGMTELGCDAPRHEQDEWMMSFLQASPAYVLEEPRLTLSDDDTTIVLLDSEVADPDRPLTGRIWDVSAVIEGGLAGAGITTLEPTLEFRDDGTLVIMTACAPGRGTYSVEGTSMQLTGVTIDDVACIDDEYVNFAAQNDEIMRLVLADGVVDFEIDADRLTLRRGDVGLWLTTD